MHALLLQAAQLVGSIALSAEEHENLLQRSIEVSYLWLIPCFPLLGAAINAFLGKRIQDRLGRSGVHRVAVAAMLLSTAVAWVAIA